VGLIRVGLTTAAPITLLVMAAATLAGTEARTVVGTIRTQGQGITMGTTPNDSLFPARSVSGVRAVPHGYNCTNRDSKLQPCHALGIMRITETDFTLARICVQI
jgi:hypothetical protein